MIKAQVNWLEELKFVGESPSGHAVVMDGDPNGVGIKPMEMILLGLGGCASIDVVSILKKARQRVVNCRTVLEAERPDTVPSPFTRINLRFVVEGRQLKDSHVARAVELSATRYCSASIMLAAAGVEISHSYDIVELD